MKQKLINEPIGEENAGQRLDNFLLKHFGALPKSLLYRMIRKGEIRVNSKRIAVHYRLTVGDQLRLPPKLRYESAQPTIKPHYPKNLVQFLNESILYEDEDMIVVNKPNGLAVHGGSSVSYGLIEVLKDAWPQWPGLELVHRIDKETSGCIMLAKRRQSLVRLHTLLKENQIKKYYYAIVQGQWQGGKTINAPLARREGSFSERLVKVDAQGDQACTEIKVIQRFKEASLIEAQPITGRTHQIRVHTEFMGHPIIGDSKYGKRDLNLQLKKLGFERLYLHAHRLIIPRVNQEPLIVTAPMPDTFNEFIAYLN